MSRLPSKDRRVEAGRMAQWVKALTTEPNYLSSVSDIHMVEGQNRLQ